MSPPLSDDAYRRFVIDDTPDIVTVLSMIGTIQYESPSIFRILGYVPGELVGKNAFRLIHPADWARASAVFAKGLLDAGVPKTVEMRVRHKDGSWKVLECVGKYVKGGKEGGYVILNSRDVSHRHEADEILRRSEANLAAAQRIAHLGSWELDFASDGNAKNHRLRWSEEAYRIFGYPPGTVSVTLDLFYSHVHPDDRERVRDAITSAIYEGTPFRIEHRILRANGEEAFLMEQAEVTRDADERSMRMLGTVLDITEAHAADQTRAMLAALFESSTDAIIVRSLEGKIIRWNPGSTRMFGYEASEAIGQPLSFLTAPDSIIDVTQVFEHVKNGATLPAIEMTCRDKAGRTLFVSQTFSAIREMSGKISAISGIGRDITTSNRMERMLAQAEKMSAVGQLAAGVAHEINNPLGVILGFAQSLLKRVQETDPYYLSIHSIEREALRCKRLVQELLTFSRDRKTGMAAELPNSIMEGALALVETQAKIRRVEIRRIVEAGLPTVDADRHQIQQVIINLCTNAMDAMPDGGTLIIGMRRQGLWLEILIEDSGTGITADAQSHIFEPFFTTKGVGKGTGLGLSLVYEIVKNHRGEVEFKSLPNQGTTFWIRIPFIAVPVTAAPVGRH